MARTPPKGVVMHLTEEQIVTDPANWKEPPAMGSNHMCRIREWAVRIQGVIAEADCGNETPDWSAATANEQEMGAVERLDRQHPTLAWHIQRALTHLAMVVERQANLPPTYCRSAVDAANNNVTEAYRSLADVCLQVANVASRL